MKHDVKRKIGRRKWALKIIGRWAWRVKIQKKMYSPEDWEMEKLKILAVRKDDQCAFGNTFLGDGWGNSL